MPISCIASFRHPHLSEVVEGVNKIIAETSQGDIPLKSEPPLFGGVKVSLDIIKITCFKGQLILMSVKKPVECNRRFLFFILSGLCVWLV